MKAMIIMLSSKHPSGALQDGCVAGWLCAEGQEWLILGHTK